MEENFNKLIIWLKFSKKNLFLQNLLQQTTKLYFDFINTKKSNKR